MAKSSCGDLRFQLTIFFSVFGGAGLLSWLAWPWSICAGKRGRNSVGRKMRRQRRGQGHLSVAVAVFSAAPPVLTSAEQESIQKGAARQMVCMGVFW